MKNLRTVSLLFKNHIGLIVVICVLAALGTAYQYNTGGETWVSKPLSHATRFCGLFLFMIFIATSSIIFWHTWAYQFYLIVLVLLATVELAGFAGMGAKRWMNLYIFTLQPSEVMKAAVILALSKYYSDIDPGKQDFVWLELIKRYVVPLLIILIPFVVVLKQPDLGTAAIIAGIGMFMMVIVEKQPKRFFLCLLPAVLALPFIWPMMYGYQKTRILTFFDPEKYPFGSGYHIIQSKIALGSGGLLGKGFLMGTQSKLNFLPEKHTDFIFATICEELGFLGGAVIILLYAYIVIYGLKIAKKSGSRFGLLISSGISVMFGLHAFINIGMVMGILPVVGIPLQMVSYGGSSMMTFMIALGIMFCVSLNKKTHIRP
ncbi:MAG: rod shape-determining protein RodA [Holosporales bacterium]|jgi:rod shape determining protein RodA|nr:rod shape-determining protein RodA [Holosporales bacterium]